MGDQCCSADRQPEHGLAMHDGGAETQVAMWKVRRIRAHRTHGKRECPLRPRSLWRETRRGASQWADSPLGYEPARAWSRRRRSVPLSLAGLRVRVRGVAWGPVRGGGSRGVRAAFWAARPGLAAVAMVVGVAW
jgi:hypothetical protein